MSRSAVREGIEGMGRTSRSGPGRRRPSTAPPTRIARGGLLDLLLVAVVALLAGTRTPAGALIQYGVELARGRDADLPTLTAWFDSGAAAPPDLELLDGPAEIAPIPEGGLPEPWRTAARTVLADPPRRVAEALATRVDLPEEDRVLAALDELYVDDAEAALELLAIGPELRDRAIARARAAGEPEPERYLAHRRYLPGPATRDADRVVNGTLALASALDLTWPVEIPHRISSGFGMRVHPTLGTEKFHNGIDLAVPIGTPIVSPQGGVVVTVGENGPSGRFVIVDHGHGLKTTYCHLETPRVAQGQEVARGERIADSGNTGRSTGPHLHWIVKIAGKAVDPARFAPKAMRS